eukprot:109691-Amphidinium_carterae.1
MHSVRALTVNFFGSLAQDHICMAPQHTICDKCLKMQMRSSTRQFSSFKSPARRVEQAQGEGPCSELFRCSACHSCKGYDARRHRYGKNTPPAIVHAAEGRKPCIQHRCLCITCGPRKAES